MLPHTFYTLPNDLSSVSVAKVGYMYPLLNIHDFRMYGHWASNLSMSRNIFSFIKSTFRISATFYNMSGVRQTPHQAYGHFFYKQPSWLLYPYAIYTYSFSASIKPSLGDTYLVYRAKCCTFVFVRSVASHHLHNWSIVQRRLVE